MSEGIILDTKLVGEIKGHFFIPDYQKGYRWGEKEATQLLEDRMSMPMDKRKPGRSRKERMNYF